MTLPGFYLLSGNADGIAAPRRTARSGDQENRYGRRESCPPGGVFSAVMGDETSTHSSGSQPMSRLATFALLLLVASPALTAESAGNEILIDADGAAPAGWLDSAQHDLEQREYELSWQASPVVDDVEASWHAPNRSQGFRTYFTSEGIRVVPRTGLTDAHFSGSVAAAEQSPRTAPSAQGLHADLFRPLNQVPGDPPTWDARRRADFRCAARAEVV